MAHLAISGNILSLTVISDQFGCHVTIISCSLLNFSLKAVEKKCKKKIFLISSPGVGLKTSNMADRQTKHTLNTPAEAGYKCEVSRRLNEYYRRSSILKDYLLVFYIEKNEKSK